MRSPGSPSRSAAEWGLRVLAVVLLAVCLVQSLLDHRSGALDATGSAALRAALARWSTVAAPARVHVALDDPPDGAERDWLTALPGAGTAVGWSGPALVPTAMSVVPVADPAGGVDVAVTAPTGAMVRLRDTVGLRDSARSAAAGVRFHLPRSGSVVEALVGPVTARESPRDSLQLGRLLVLGQAGWEAKFVAAALQERGWLVDARLTVAPRADVSQGTVAGIDTSRYSAILALDSTAAREAGRIVRFVRSGGGLVLWSSAASAAGLAGLAPGFPGAPIADPGLSPASGEPRAALDLLPITRLTADAVVLERQGSHVSVAARRVGPGRVVEIGYVDLWRWRMEGGEGAPEAHRAWLARLVAGVAHTGRAQIEAPAADAAPLATLIQQLGPPAAAELPGPIDWFALWSRWVFVLICLALLAEWASRRLRGLR